MTSQSHCCISCSEGYLIRCGDMGTCHYLGIRFLKRGRIIGISFLSMCEINSTFRKNIQNYGHCFPKIWQKLPKEKVICNSCLMIFVSF